MVLDRPNPINGFQIEGPALDKGHARRSRLLPRDADPARHDARRAGEAVQRREQDRRRPDRRPMQNWHRDDWFDETGLPWINPSPNMRNLIQATLYPGIGAIETTNISVGRGTDTPFEQIGAPWIDGPQLADALNARRTARASASTRSASRRRRASTPTKRVSGVFMIVTDRPGAPPGAASASRSRRCCTSCTARSSSSKRPSGCSDQATVWRACASGEDPAAIARSWAAAEARWRLLRAPYLLY